MPSYMSDYEVLKAIETHRAKQLANVYFVLMYERYSGAWPGES